MASDYRRSFHRLLLSVGIARFQAIGVRGYNSRAIRRVEGLLGSISYVHLGWRRGILPTRIPHAHHYMVASHGPFLPHQDCRTENYTVLLSSRTYRHT